MFYVFNLEPSHTSEIKLRIAPAATISGSDLVHLLRRGVRIVQAITFGCIPVIIQVRDFVSPWRKEILLPAPCPMFIGNTGQSAGIVFHSHIVSSVTT